MRRAIVIEPEATDEWLECIKILLYKLGAMYSEEDADKFRSTAGGDRIVVTYNDVVTDKLLDNMNKRYYLNSTKLCEDKRYKELEESTGLSGAELDALIAATYSNMTLSCLQKYKSETSNVRFYWDRCKARDIDLLAELRGAKPVEDIVCLHKTT